MKSRREENKCYSHFNNLENFKWLTILFTIYQSEE